jgi:hypothetical protein
MTPSSTVAALMPSRVIDSMTGHFTRNSADASCTPGAPMVTRQARRSPPI